jgi:hypothetical protein
MPDEGSHAVVAFLREHGMSAALPLATRLLREQFGAMATVRAHLRRDRESGDWGVIFDLHTPMSTTFAAEQAFLAQYLELFPAAERLHGPVLMWNPTRLLPPPGETTADDIHQHAVALRALREVATSSGDRPEGAEDTCPPSEGTVARTRRAILALPSWCPSPMVARESRGSISLDWPETRGILLSLSVDAHGQFGFAMVRGNEHVHGVLRGSADLPLPVIFLLQGMFLGSQ